MFKSLYPLYNTGHGISYICSSLCEHLGNDDLPVESWFPSSAIAVHYPFVRNAYPRWAMPLIYRLSEPGKRLAKGVERAFVRSLRSGDIAYLWPGVSTETFQRIKELGITIVAERINCHTRYAKRLLDAEYVRIGWPPSHGITEEDIEAECQQMELADLIFSPSPLVTESLMDCGVPLGKILPSSYGWDSERMRGTSRLVEKEEGLTLLFVGRLSLRKGIHLLLEAWKRTKITGRLLLAGGIDQDVAEHLAADLARPNVIQLGHTLDVGAVYRSADVFVFPSLEEGSPLVSYEAMGCGLPVIVSPMGIGPARDGSDGFVINPHDIDAWSAALKRFAEDRELCTQMGNSARKHAEEFTWQKVATRRREALLTALQCSGL